MGKKPAKKKAKGTRANPAKQQPIAALYQLDAGTPRGDAVRAVLSDQGLRIRTVTPDNLGDSVGSVVGMMGMKPSSKPYNGDVPDCEFMLLHNISSDKLGKLLGAMRDANASVGCKAQVTQYNRLWPFGTLISEVSKEHVLMTGAADESQAESDES